MEDRTVLITGAARGIGRAIAERYKAAGWHLLTPSRTQLDLAAPDSIARFAGETGNTSVDVLINNAGENPVAELASLQLETFQQSLLVNLLAPWLLLRAVVPHMAARHWGRIVNVSSCYSIVTRRARGAYGAAKAGLNSLTRTAALEYAESNILINSVCPGFVETDLTYRNNTREQIQMLCSDIPLARLARPEEIASFVYFLGSEDNTYITGQSLAIDGGFLCQ